MSLDFPNEKTIDLSLWDYLTDVDGLNADAPNQSRFNLAVEGFKKASEHFVSEHGTAVNAYEQMKDRDLTGGMSFEQWAQQNAPAFRIALQEFQATRHQVRVSGELAYGAEYSNRISQGDERSKHTAYGKGLYY